MKALKLSMLAAVMLCGITLVKAQDANEIMGKHVAAIGGLDNWNKLTSMKATGTFSQGGMDISIAQSLIIGKAMRMDISVMGMNGFQIVTNKDGWMYMPFMGGAKLDTMKPEMLKAYQKQLDVKTSQKLDYKADGTKLEYAGKDTVNKMPCFKVKLTDKEGNESTVYVDCNTYYILRAESKVKQDDQEQEVAVLYDNYKKLDGGVVMPMSVNAGGVDITFKTIEVNTPIDESIFVPAIPKDKPADTKTQAEPQKANSSSNK